MSNHSVAVAILFFALGWIFHPCKAENTVNGIGVPASLKEGSWYEIQSFPQIFVDETTGEILLGIIARRIDSLERNVVLEHTKFYAVEQKKIENSTGGNLFTGRNIIHYCGGTAKVMEVGIRWHPSDNGC